ncbi:MAG TPA: tetratricopeptide repeat protein [Rariglobus sp.]|jgi:tetratricopeptide (TPR) repeat protein|nr:tetratricopeptide repeat protein [Rariglobus sp.]
MDWKPELDAIVSARHGGQVEHVLGLLKKLDARYPNIAEITYQLAWTHDVSGKPAESVPLYEKAVALGLSPAELSGALIHLGAALVSSGQSVRAVDVLEAGRRQFPENREFDAFLALALHGAGRHAEAMQLLLTTLVENTEDIGINAYQRALRFHASRLTSGH